MNNDDTRYLAEKQDQLPRPHVEADEAAKERLRQNLHKSNRSKSVTVVTILFLLIVLGAGVLGYYWFQAKQEIDSKQLEVAAAEDTVSQLRMQVSKLKSEAIATESVKKDDKTLITEEIQAKAHAVQGKESTKVDVTIEKQGDAFAVAKTTDGRHILKKVGEQWVIVYSGQATPSAEVIKQYGIPAQYQ